MCQLFYNKINFKIMQVQYQHKDSQFLNWGKFVILYKILCYLSKSSTLSKLLNEFSFQEGNYLLLQKL